MFDFFMQANANQQCIMVLGGAIMLTITAMGACVIAMVLNGEI